MKSPLKLDVFAISILWGPQGLKVLLIHTYGFYEEASGLLLFASIPISVVLYISDQWNYLHIQDPEVQ